MPRTLNQLDLIAINATLWQAQVIANILLEKAVPLMAADHRVRKVKVLDDGLKLSVTPVTPSPRPGDPQNGRRCSTKSPAGSPRAALLTLVIALSLREQSRKLTRGSSVVDDRSLPPKENAMDAVLTRAHGSRIRRSRSS